MKIMHQRIFPDFHIIISLIFLSLIFSACADGSLKSISPENIITGTYDLEGTQINQQICMIGCPPEREGEIMQSDTFHVSFPVEIKFYENRKDTLIFSGLEGADVYIRNLGSNRRVSNPRCLANNNLYDCAYAVIKHDRIVFDLIRPGGAYTGEGKLKNGKLELKTNYFYRGINVDYDLSGRKVD